MPSVPATRRAKRNDKRITDVHTAIREARLRADMSLAEAARFLNCDKATLSRLETGQATVTAEWAAATARLYKDPSILALWLAQCPAVKALAEVA